MHCCCCVTTAQSLSTIVREITTGLLKSKPKRGSKSSCMKIDFNLIEQDSFVSVHITQCQSAASSNLYRLVTEALSGQINFPTLAQEVVVVLIEEKSVSKVKVRKILYSGNTSFTSITDKVPRKPQKEFSLLKNYVSIKLLLHVEKNLEQLFLSLLLADVKHLERDNSDVKFVIRRNKEHIYRNRVWMDDVFLSCSVFSSCCTSIFETSENFEFRNKIVSELGIKKPQAFTEIVGCLLLAQASHNFSRPKICKKNK